MTIKKMEERKTRAVVAVIVIALVIGLAPFPGSSGNLEAGEDCGDCHEDFKAFEVRTISPEDPGPGEEVTFRSIISNPGDHALEEVTARILLPGQEDPGSGTHAFSGSVARGTSMDYEFTIGLGASGLHISIDEQPPPPGLADLSMTLSLPDGTTMTSDSGTSMEEIDVGEEELRQAGPGTASVVITHVSGLRSVSFEGTVDLEYQGAMVREIGRIEAGERARVEWNLTMGEEDCSEFSVEVKGRAVHDHGSSGGERSRDYVKQKSFDTSTKEGEGDGGTEIPRSVRWPLRYGLATLLPISIILGVPRTRDLISARTGLGSERLRKTHCYVSYVMVPLFIVHALMETTRHPWTSDPAITGILTSVFVVGLAICGSQRSMICRRFSGKTWTLMHKFLTAGAVLALAVHFLI